MKREDAERLGIVTATQERAEEMLRGKYEMIGSYPDLVAQTQMWDGKTAAVAAGTFMKAPNGKATNLTELQWLLVRTAAFNRWFGEWERAAELTFDGKEYDN